MVNYLRNDRTVFPEFIDPNDEIHFFKELDFWKIPTKQHTAKKRKLPTPQNQTASSNPTPPKYEMQQDKMPMSYQPKRMTQPDDPFSDVRSEDS